MFDKMEKLAGLKKEIESQAKDALKDAAKEFFTKHPEVNALRWHQYVPGFNDGDPCLFTMGGLTVRFNDAAAEEEDDEDEDLGGFTSKYQIKGKALKSDLEDLESLLAELDSCFQAAFGDNAEVTVTEKEITVSEYDCG